MEIIEMPIDENYLEEKLGKSIEEIDNSLDTLKIEANNLRDLFYNKIRIDNHKEKIIDKLHSEVMEYKGGLIEKLTWPLILDLIIAIDNLNKNIENIENKEGITKEYALKCIKGIKEDLDEILYRQGIEEYKDEEVKFEPKRQKILKVYETDDIDMDRIVKRTAKLGYEMGEKIIRKQLVDIYSYKKSEVKTKVICKNIEENENQTLEETILSTVLSENDSLNIEKIDKD